MRVASIRKLRDSDTAPNDPVHAELARVVGAGASDEGAGEGANQSENEGGLEHGDLLLR